MHFQRWSSIEDLAGPQLRTKFGVIEVNLVKANATAMLSRCFASDMYTI